MAEPTQTTPESPSSASRGKRALYHNEKPYMCKKATQERAFNGPHRDEGPKEVKGPKFSIVEANKNLVHSARQLTPISHFQNDDATVKLLQCIPRSS